MDTRQIEASEITLAVKKMFMDCNYFIGDDILSAIKSSYEEESLPVAKDVLNNS